MPRRRNSRGQRPNTRSIRRGNARSGQRKRSSGRNRRFRASPSTSGATVPAGAPDTHLRTLSAGGAFPFSEIEKNSTLPDEMQIDLEELEGYAEEERALEEEERVLKTLVASNDIRVLMPPHVEDMVNEQMENPTRQKKMDLLRVLMSTTRTAFPSDVRNDLRRRTRELIEHVKKGKVTNVALLREDNDTDAWNAIIQHNKQAFIFLDLEKGKEVGRQESKPLAMRVSVKDGERRIEYLVVYKNHTPPSDGKIYSQASMGRLAACLFIGEYITLLTPIEKLEAIANTPFLSYPTESPIRAVLDHVAKEQVTKVEMRSPLFVNPFESKHYAWLNEHKPHISLLVSTVEKKYALFYFQCVHIGDQRIDDLLVGHEVTEG